MREGEHKDWSIVNSEKLDRLMQSFARMEQALEGDGADSPGLFARVGLMERVLFGKEGEQGLAFRVAILWRVNFWVWCTLSALAGAAITKLGELLFK